MPEPRSFTMCPQCGCVKKDQGTSDQNMFDCGETVSRGPQGLQTSYTCHTLPAYRRTTEAKLAMALTSVPLMRLKGTQWGLIDDLSKREGYTHGVKKDARTILICTDAGLVERGAPNEYRLTSWGTDVHRIMKETTYG